MRACINIFCNCWLRVCAVYVCMCICVSVCVYVLAWMLLGYTAGLIPQQPPGCGLRDWLASRSVSGFRKTSRPKLELKLGQA